MWAMQDLENRVRLLEEQNQIQKEQLEVLHESVELLKLIASRSGSKPRRKPSSRPPRNAMLNPPGLIRR
ncbi:hypothetical protein VT84_03490 [Gemmata sp. SH-PL17]|nr:hypothetical protein VT84_03490 [Gemmata sp. SH-PL17]